jgi:DNA-directed RNA polymerase subunit RPC12/RpoP
MQDMDAPGVPGMIDSDRIQNSYQCKKCGKILPIIGSIIPRNPNWYCSNCGTEGKLGEAFEAIK